MFLAGRKHSFGSSARVSFEEGVCYTDSIRDDGSIKGGGETREKSIVAERRPSVEGLFLEDPSTSKKQCGVFCLYGIVDELCWVDS